jgi:hypothetical protein
MGYSTALLVPGLYTKDDRLIGEDLVGSGRGLIEVLFMYLPGASEEDLLTSSCTISNAPIQLGTPTRYVTG